MDKRLCDVLREVWRSTVKVKSNYARLHAEYIAMAASLQLITTKVGPSTYAGAWQITGKGLSWLNEKDDDEE